MWNKIKTLLGLTKPAVQPPLDMIERIEHNLGLLTNEVIDRYSIRKSLNIRVVLSSETPKELREWLSTTGRVMSNVDYPSEVWKAGVRIERGIILDDYMTHEGYVVRFPVWFEENRPRMERIIKAIHKLDEVDREYYQRIYNSVLRDMDSLLKGALIACN